MHSKVAAGSRFTSAGQVADSKPPAPAAAGSSARSTYEVQYSVTVEELLAAA